jgi:hypothetical protein
LREDLLDDRRFQDRRNDLELAAAVRAVREVDREHALEQLGPAQAHRSVARTVRLARGGWRGLCGRLGLLRHHQRAQLGIGRRQAVVREAGVCAMRRAPHDGLQAAPLAAEGDQLVVAAVTATQAQDAVGLARSRRTSALLQPNSTGRFRATSSADHVITRHRLGQAGLEAAKADSGAVTLTQGFGSAANLTDHLRCSERRRSRGRARHRQRPQCRQQHGPAGAELWMHDAPPQDGFAG